MKKKISNKHDVKINKYKKWEHNNPPRLLFKRLKNPKHNTVKSRFRSVPMQSRKIFVHLSPSFFAKQDDE